MENYKTSQLIPDPAWETGFQIMSQKDHQNGDRVQILGTLPEEAPLESARWYVAQWDSGPCLWENRISTHPWQITDGKWRSLFRDPKKNTLTFLLDTSLYYGGNPARVGDYWPHLLIEQGSFGCSDLPETERAPYRCSAKKLTVSFDIRLKEYSETPIAGDWVRAAQFLMFFYVKGIRTNDFCWFGMQLFDSRYAENDHYIAYDGGKADASGAMIYSIGSRYVYKNSRGRLWQNGQPSPDGKWIHIELDLKPYLEDMLRWGKDDGYFKADSLDELVIDGMNLGWESIGTFRHVMEITPVRLIAE